MNREFFETKGFTDWGFKLITIIFLLIITVFLCVIIIKIDSQEKQINIIHEVLRSDYQKRGSRLDDIEDAVSTNQDELTGNLDVLTKKIDSCRRDFHRKQ